MPDWTVDIKSLSASETESISLRTYNLLIYIQAFTSLATYIYEWQLGHYRQNHDQQAKLIAEA
ncbi:hypothetical protein RchiOBHm_Chr1g0343891 [Rosa chinensis]|uniref:Uncharacterized protein n=1 Tax=Rosa chinensis TaxID=74649 RepID=A0A2P6SEC9_ROSCH|nr:hypothetical protein RchiOBHm_Chr1g0343891 [Rosa chinensis]